MHDKSYLEVSPEAGKNFFSKGLEGPVTMLNLLRYRDVADYSQFPELAPSSPISGEEAYQLYMEHTTPLLKKAGSEVIFMGKANSFLIGPESEKWDLVLLVRHVGAMPFLGFARDPEYLKTAGHRTAALADSRLLPIT